MPKALRAGQAAGWALLSAVHHQPRSPFGPWSFRDNPTPHPQVFSVACGAPAPGDRSAGSDAQPRLPAFASAPSPARAAQDAASEQRPRGSGPRPDRAPGQPGRRRPSWPSRSDPPLCPGFWGNQMKASSANLPAAPGTPSSPTLAPNTPSGARLALCAQRGWSRGGGWGQGGGGASADDHFGVRRSDFHFIPGLAAAASSG